MRLLDFYLVKFLIIKILSLILGLDNIRTMLVDESVICKSHQQIWVTGRAGCGPFQKHLNNFYINRRN